jgi:hypothetical protein
MLFFTPAQCRSESPSDKGNSNPPLSSLKNTRARWIASGYAELFALKKFAVIIEGNQSGECGR